MTFSKPEVVVRAVLFDFDGTITRPHNINFTDVREAIGCPANLPVLEYIESISDQKQRRRAERLLDRFEMEAADRVCPNEGMVDAIHALAALGVPMGILTRNSAAALSRSFNTLDGIARADFMVVLARDDGHKPKPHPDGIMRAARIMGVSPGELLCVGDHNFDVEGAGNAGCRSVFLTNGETAIPSESPDFIVTTLAEVVDVVRFHRPLPMGKLPNELLDQILVEFAVESSDIVVPPAVGEDCAVVKPGGDDALVLTSDPITFVTNEIGYYAVIVNANDVAAAGAIPRWFLATLLLPVGSTAAAARDIVEQLYLACSDLVVSLCGGHTEITDSVTRPVVSGHMIGGVAQGGLLRKSDISPGDRIILTKRLAVEGTAIIARESSARLEAAGVAADVISRATDLLHTPGISVIVEARAALDAGGVKAMHDVTEGGLATALRELSIAAGHGIRVSADQIPLYPETSELCRALDLNPLGLIGSGSLLIACSAESADTVAATIRQAGVEAVTIAEVTNAPAGVSAIREKTGCETEFPRFDVDELARLFGQRENQR